MEKKHVVVTVKGGVVQKIVMQSGVIVTVFPDGGYRHLSGGIWL